MSQNTVNEAIKGLVELLKAAFQYLPWPLVTLVFILIFRHQIESVIKKLCEVLGTIPVKFAAPGFSFEVTPAQQAKPPETGIQQASTASPDVEKSEAYLKLSRIDGWDSPSVKWRIKLINEEVKGLNITPDQREEILTLNLAVAQARASAEFIYRTIFGSQIALLKTIASFNRSVQRSFLEFAYDSAKRKFAALYDQYSFLQWV